MEEEQAAAYYDEITRKGEGAARFKQGLGFSSSAPSKPPSAPPPFLSNFVKASSGSTQAELDPDPPPRPPSQSRHQAQLESVQNKLKKKPTDEDRARSTHYHRRSSCRDRADCYSRRPSRSRSRSRERHATRRMRSSRTRSRSRSRSSSPRRGRTSHWSRSLSPPEERKRHAERNRALPDYSHSIPGYDNMSPAERVKARMKLQLHETAKKDNMSSGWERFEFDKDAPLDDEEIEAAEDDAGIAKQIGQSFRFSAVEARREEKIKAAHEEAMFGAPTLPASVLQDTDVKAGNIKNEVGDMDISASLLSEKVLAKQQGSWRDRARKGQRDQGENKGSFEEK